jgi:protein-disulfide isomerase
MSESQKFELNPSIAIIVAGVIIAGAIIYSNTQAAGPAAGGTQPLPSTQTNVRAPSAQDHIVGSLSAPLVLIEYSDFQCPYCNLINPTLKRLVNESNGSIAWVYRHLPLTSIHPEARPSAIAAECVYEQLGDEGFWQFGDTMFTNQKSMSAAYYEQVATSLGVDSAQFKSCVASQKYASKVDADAQEAMKNGGQGTPYTVLYDSKGQVGVSGALPYETFSSVIKAFKERQ